MGVDGVLSLPTVQSGNRSPEVRQSPITRLLWIPLDAERHGLCLKGMP